MNGQHPRPPGNPLRLNAKTYINAAGAGGSAAQLYELVENENTYVVKFKENPQGIRVVFNEYVSGRWGELIGVPFGEHALVTIADVLRPGARPPQIGGAGTHFGTRYFPYGQTDFGQLQQARNFTEFPSVVVFDTLIARRNGRQYLVYPSSENQNDPRDMGAIFDQGYAFTGTPNWNCAALQAEQNCIADDGLGLKRHFGLVQACEPYIQRVEALTTDEIRAVVSEAPLAEWQVTDEEAAALVAWLDRRKFLVRAAIENYSR